MELTQAADLVQEIHNKLSLQYRFLIDWEVTYDRARRRAGICRLNEKQISFSELHFIENTDEIVSDTILHEFAHAIAFKLYGDKGHGLGWKKIASKIGAVPKATGKYKLPQAPWYLVHDCHYSGQIEKVAPRYRRNKSIKHYFLRNNPGSKGRLYFVKSIEFEEYCRGERTVEELQLYQ